MQLARYNPRPHHSQQKGVALITMMLIFVLVTILVSSTVSRNSLDIQRTSHLLDDTQAYQYALGGEALARQWLYEDLMADDRSPQDHTGEQWYQLSNFEPDQGHIRLLIRDLESRFNLNNLRNDSGDINYDQLQAFQRLLVELRIDTALALRLADWLDSNVLPQTFDSEDNFFLGQDPAYRSGNRIISDPSELQALVNLDRDQWLALEAEVTALPTTTAINPNTASTAVITTLAKGMNGDKVVNDRNSREQGFTSVEDFLEASSTAGIKLEPQKITVTSDYFEVWIEAEFASRRLYLRSHLHRDPTSGKISLLERALIRPPSNIQKLFDESRARTTQLDSQ